MAFIPDEEMERHNYEGFRGRENAAAREFASVIAERQRRHDTPRAWHDRPMVLPTAPAPLDRDPQRVLAATEVTVRGTFTLDAYRRRFVPSDVDELVEPSQRHSTEGTYARRRSQG